jgi:hypothetical protein
MIVAVVVFVTSTALVGSSTARVTFGTIAACERYADTAAPQIDAQRARLEMMHGQPVRALFLCHDAGRDA